MVLTANRGVHEPQELHCACQRIFEEHGYLILSSAGFDYGTYCHDGVLAARAPNIHGIEPIELPLRVQAGDANRCRQRQGGRGVVP